jgi:hypothetical protein
MERDVIAVALRVLNAITRGHIPTQQDRDALKCSVVDQDQELPIDDIARLIVNRELLKHAVERRITKMA